MAIDLVSNENLLKAVVAVRECLLKKNSKELFTSDKFFLQISVKRIINEPPKLIKTILPHTPVNLKTTDICLFVKDVNKNSREYEKTIDAYEELFKECGVGVKIEIFPLKKLKTEFNDYEAKRRLSNLYDVFLCDSRIIRLMPSLLGKHFLGRKKFLNQVRMDKLNLKSELDKCLRTSISDMKNRGSTCQAFFGSTSNTDSELVANLRTCLSSLVSSTPGGVQNIRLACIKSEHSASVPLYISYGDKSEINIDDKVKLPGNSDDPDIIGTSSSSSWKNRNLFLEEAEEVSTVTNGLVVVTEGGEVLVVGEDGEIIGGDDDDGGGDDGGGGGDNDGEDDDNDDDDRLRKREGDDGNDVDDEEEEDGDDDDDESGGGKKRKKANNNNNNNNKNKKIKLGDDNTETTPSKNTRNSKNRKPIANNSNAKNSNKSNSNAKNSKNSKNSKNPKNSAKHKNSNKTINTTSDTKKSTTGASKKNFKMNKGKVGNASGGERSKVKRVVVGKGRDDLRYSGGRVG